jgi:hypothetical protein
MNSIQYKFRTPSNELIILDNKYTYREIFTVADLKYLFTFRNFLYRDEGYDIGMITNKRLNTIEILDVNTKLTDIVVDEYQIIHNEKSHPSYYYKNTPETNDDNIITETKASDNIITENKASDDIITETKASDNIITETKASDNIITETKASDNIITETKASDNIITENKAGCIII